MMMFPAVSKTSGGLSFPAARTGTGHRKTKPSSSNERKPSLKASKEKRTKDCQLKGLKISVKTHEAV